MLGKLWDFAASALKEPRKFLLLLGLFVVAAVITKLVAKWLDLAHDAAADPRTIVLFVLVLLIELAIAAAFMGRGSEPPGAKKGTGR